MARYNQEWSLAEIAAASNDFRPLPTAALRTAQEEAERIIRERQAAAGKPCATSPASATQAR